MLLINSKLFATSRTLKMFLLTSLLLPLPCSVLTVQGAPSIDRHLRLCYGALISHIIRGVLENVCKLFGASR